MSLESIKVNCGLWFENYFDNQNTIKEISCEWAICNLLR